MMDMTRVLELDRNMAVLSSRVAEMKMRSQAEARLALVIGSNIFLMISPLLAPSICAASSISELTLLIAADEPRKAIGRNRAANAKIKIRDVPYRFSGGVV